MGKKLENLAWKPMWVSHLGCIKGCLDYLKLDVSDAWLYGATGHAFVINIHEVVCPSGPTAWHTGALFRLGKNIGYSVDGVWGKRSDRDFSRKQELAWKKTQSAIDHAWPCYGWELEIPEYYVINGYDEVGYYFSGPRCDLGNGPRPWRELGDTKIGWLEMYWIKPGKPARETTAIKGAFAFALEHAQSPSKWIFPKYRAGLAGFQNWISALEEGRAHGFGVAYNAAVWSECRKMAVEFLKEAKERTDGKLAPLFDDAKAHYEVVAENLGKVSGIFPFPPQAEEVADRTRCEEAIEYLANARKAEELGLKSIETILSRLS